ncbi:PPK2 family polyphosphate kinase [Hyphomonas sp.]|uniref:PPK2 family polyphosphate kinase n=1 Tax=Hyphomonas sp. TaxID=87 RepID=UPI003919292C
MAIPSIAAVRKALIAPPGKAFELSGRDTTGREILEDKAEAETSLKKDAAVINELKDMLYAEGRRSLLVILQGMDTAGKSGTIKSVFSETTPLGMEVKAFKAPSSEELARDYLWRVHNAVPRRGNVGIFDRSHYEDVLVVRVRGFAPIEEVEKRYDQINAFEKHLSENGTTVLKFMLNVGYEEQGIRLKERLEEVHKLWKFNPVDLEDRSRWSEFMQAYELAIRRCSTRHAPWYIIPSDSLTRRSALIARIVRGALEDMDLKWKDPGFAPGSFDFG